MRMDRELVVGATADNTSFSTLVPGQQLAVDSTSLGVFKECPRKYLFSIVLGRREVLPQTDLVFGLIIHGAREQYDHAKAKGQDHDTALNGAVLWALRETWDTVLRRPKWPVTPAVPAKTRRTCICTIVWYLDQYGETDNLETVILSNGKPAIELSFQFFPGWTTAQGESYFICGHFDRVARLNGAAYILDIKTTKSPLDRQFFTKFKVDNQMSLYDFAGQVVLPDSTKGIMIDGIQVQVEGNRFYRQLSTRDEAERNEWAEGTRAWLARMEECATTLHWPANEKSCGMYRGCQFQSVCARSPAQRLNELRLNFRREAWDPLKKRGDI